MECSSSRESPSIISIILLFFCFFSPIFSFPKDNGTSIDARVRKIKKLKPYVKSIKSPDGDIIDCVMFHLQLAFNLPKLREKMSMNYQPELPKGYNGGSKNSELKQLWNSMGESCPNGTIPIRRTRASDHLLTSIQISKSRNKSRSNDLYTHEHAIARVTGEFYGAKAVLNVWQPNVIGNEMSLSQIWVYTTDIPDHLENTIEAGWHVYPNLNKGDSHPRLFTFWTPDGYQSGCYNLMCPGFVQTNPKYSLGASIDPISTYNGELYDVAFMIWKESTTGDWCLMIGSEVMGYWPATLFSDLRDHATTVDYGGEVAFLSSDKHTSTQMGSGHFQEEAFGKAAFTRNLQVVDKENTLYPVNDLDILAENPECYNVGHGYVNNWADYIFFGGPGNNPKCP